MEGIGVSKGVSTPVPVKTAMKATANTEFIELRKGISVRYVGGTGANADTYEHIHIRSKTDLPLEIPKGGFLGAYAHCYDGELTHKTSLKLSNTFKQYYQDSIDKHGTFQVVDQAVRTLIDRYSKMGFDAKEITPQIIKDVYESCRMYAVSGASTASFFEGCKVANQLGASNGFIYYNSDYYYRSEDMKDALYDHCQELAEKYDCGSLEFFREYPDGDIRKCFYESYNSPINDNARMWCGNIIDEKVAPPPGFRLYYDPNGRGVNVRPEELEKAGAGSSIFDGRVFVWYQDWSFSSLVPVQKDPSLSPLSVNLLDLVQHRGNDYPKELEKILGNFDFFATNLGSLYKKTHSRIM